MQNKLSQNFLIGISFLIALVLLYFGVNFLKGVNVLKKKNTYAVVFEDVTGLYPSSPIYLNGFQIGLVNNIKMLSSHPIRFVVDVNLEVDYRIPKGSHFEFGSDFLGASAVSLIASDDGVGYYSLGDTLRGEREEDMMANVSKILPRADSLLLHLDSFAVSVNRLINSKEFSNMFSGIENTIAELNESGRQLNIAIATLNGALPEITSNLSYVTSDLKGITDNIASLDIDKTFSSIDATLENVKEISAKLNSEDNSLGKLTSDTQMHDSLTNALGSVSKLLEEIRENPKKYLSVRVKLF